MGMQTIINRAVEQIESYVDELPRVNGDALNLDSRIYGIYVDLNDRTLIIEGHVGTINYYGGFEYIDNEHVTTFGNYTMFSGEADRVNDCLEYYEEVTLGEKRGVK